jgi:2,4-dienoyl-CoA reductase-like NADH-dependent reductase (Old Yellow Enzyme family)/NADH dehydrogenase FAD-containing subunit
MIRFHHIFQPGKIGTVKLKNRLIMAPVTTLYATEEGEVCDRAIDFFAERARGGVGMIIVEGTFINPGGKRIHKCFNIYDDKYIFGLEKLAVAVKKAGANIFIQLSHGGRECVSEITGRPIVAPSPIPSPFRGIAKDEEPPKELTKTEIAGLVSDFCTGAERAQKAGFDGVELHGAHGYLINQFLSSYSNKRMDEYGGDIYGRLRFLEEVVTSIKTNVKGFPLIVRFNGEDGVPGGNTIEEGKIIARKMEQKGAHALHVSSGFHESRPYRPIPNMSVDKMCYVALAEQIKFSVHIPVITVGRITLPEEAEQILLEAKADFIALGRALLADQDFPSKAMMGDLEDIRYCVGCNQGCIDKCHKLQPISCIYNPTVGKEKQANIEPAKNPRKIAVIGAGPGGMEAAYVAAMRGHHVDLYEKSDSLGGQLRIAVIPPTRDELNRIIRYLEHQLSKWHVGVHLNTEVDEAFLKNLQADVIILATGSRPASMPIPIETENFFTAEDALRGEWTIKEGHVAVIGGGLVGCETADFLGEQGYRITLFEMLNDICMDTGRATRVYLTDKLNSLGIDVKTRMKVKKIHQHKIFCEHDGKEMVFSGMDAYVMATGYVPDQSLKKILLEMKKDVYEIGDCKQVANALESIHQAFWLAKDI